MLQNKNLGLDLDQATDGLPYRVKIPFCKLSRGAVRCKRVRLDPPEALQLIAIFPGICFASLFAWLQSLLVSGRVSQLSSSNAGVFSPMEQPGVLGVASPRGPYLVIDAAVLKTISKVLCSLSLGCLGSLTPRCGPRSACSGNLEVPARTQT